MENENTPARFDPEQRIERSAGFAQLLEVGTGKAVAIHTAKAPAGPVGGEAA
jgi:hypothetical protein